MIREGERVPRDFLASAIAGPTLGKNLVDDDCVPRLSSPKTMQSLQFPVNRYEGQARKLGKKKEGRKQKNKPRLNKPPLIDDDKSDETRLEK